MTDDLKTPGDVLYRISRLTENIAGFRKAIAEAEAERDALAQRLSPLIPDGEPVNVITGYPRRCIRLSQSPRGVLVTPVETVDESDLRFPEPPSAELDVDETLSAMADAFVPVGASS